MRIDTDICYFRRPEVIEYAKQKYIHVAQIGNNITSKLRSTIESVFRVYGFTQAQANEIKKLVPQKINQIDTTWNMMQEIHDDPNGTLAKKVEDHEVKQIIENFIKLNQELDKLDPRVKRDILALEGIVRGTGIHAGGVLLCDRPIEEFAPMMASSSTAILPVCSLNMKSVDDIGLLKVDLLGSRSITVIDQAARDAGVDLEHLDLTDAKVWKAFQDGYYHAIFQMQGGGMTKLAKELKLECFDDLINLLALYRPGPLKGIVDTQAGTTMVQQYVINRHDPSQVRYEHPDLEPILKSTKGILIFQEQLMAIVQKFAGYTMGGADLWRRAVGKKDAKLLAELKDEFINGSYETVKDEAGNWVPVIDPATNQPKVKVPGCIRRGYSKELAEYLYTMMEFFAGYGFNKAHSAVYALNAYRTMYLKIYHPVEFMRAVLSSEADSLDKTTENLKECKRLGIKILPPDINKSETDFTIEEVDGIKCIRYGLSAVKMIGEGHVVKIKAQRPFNSMANFASTVPGKGFDRRHVVNLIKAGAFDQFNPNRFVLLNEYNFSIRKFKEVLRLSGTDQPPKELKVGSNEAIRYLEDTWCKEAALLWEKELLGSYVTGHPYDDLPYTKWDYIPDRAPLEYGGRIMRTNLHTTQKGEEMAFFTLETAQDMRDVVVFPKVWAQHKSKIKDNALVIVRGKKDFNRGSILADEVVSATRSARAKAKKQVAPVQMPVIDTSNDYQPAPMPMVDHGYTPVPIPVDYSEPPEPTPPPDVSSYIPGGISETDCLPPASPIRKAVDEERERQRLLLEMYG